MQAVSAADMSLSTDESRTAFQNQLIELLRAMTGQGQGTDVPIAPVPLSEAEAAKLQVASPGSDNQIPREEYLLQLLSQLLMVLMENKGLQLGASQAKAQAMKGAPSDVQFEQFASGSRVDKLLQDHGSDKDALARALRVSGRQDVERINAAARSLQATPGPMMRMGESEPGIGDQQITVPPEIASQIALAASVAEGEEILRKWLAETTGTTDARETVNQVMGTNIQRGVEKDSGSQLMLDTMVEQAVKGIRSAKTSDIGSGTPADPNAPDAPADPGAAVDPNAPADPNAPGAQAADPNAPAVQAMAADPNAVAQANAADPNATDPNAADPNAVIGQAPAETDPAAAESADDEVVAVDDPAPVENEPEDDSTFFTAPVTLDFSDDNYLKAANEIGGLASPLTLDIDGDGKYVSDRLVDFDIDGDGKKDRINDVDAEDFLLVWDADGDGKAGENGHELFGDNTRLDVDGDGQYDRFNNGFEALIALARQQGLVGNGDNQLSQEDLKILERQYGFAIRKGGLNGIDLSFAEAGLRELNVGEGPVTTEYGIQGTNNAVSRRQGAGFTLDDGTSGDMVDVWFDTNIQRNLRG